MDYLGRDRLRLYGMFQPTGRMVFPGNKAVIPSGTPNSPQVKTTTASVYDITINAGATVPIASSNALNVFNKWNNQGSFMANASTVN